MPHFEIPVTDGPRARAFYAGLFGWAFVPMPGGEDFDHHLIEGERIGMDKGLSGAIMLRSGPAPLPGSPVRGSTMVFEVDDCDARYAWALLHGGAEALPPTTGPGVGRYAYVEDGEGNIVGLITPEGGV